MTSGVPPVTPEAQAILTALRLAHPRVGYCEAPGDAELPYAVLWPLTPRYDGPMGDQWADLHGDYQVTSVGETPEQALALADRLRSALLTGLITIPSRVVMQVQHRTSQPVRRDDDLGVPRLFLAVDQYRVSTTPA